MEGKGWLDGVLEGGGRKKWLLRGGGLVLGRGIEEVVVARFASKGSSQLDGQRGNVKVKKALVGPVGGCTGPE